MKVWQALWANRRCQQRTIALRIRNVIESAPSLESSTTAAKDRIQQTRQSGMNPQTECVWVEEISHLEEVEADEAESTRIVLSPSLPTATGHQGTINRKRCLVLAKFAQQWWLVVVPSCSLAGLVRTRILIRAKGGKLLETASEQPMSSH